MPNWHEILNELKASGSIHDIIRRKYISELRYLTGRNTIVYYSGWLQKPGLPGTELTDADKNGFMSVIHGLDKREGLDLLLHTPGGETAATESLVDFLRSIFGTDVRAIVPQLAMSAGTMIACACKEIVMGKQSSLGAIDPLVHGMPAHGVVEEFLRAQREIQADPSKAAVWQPILAKYQPTLVGECEKAVTWSGQMVKEWLLTGMLSEEGDADQLAAEIVGELAGHSLTMSPARHISCSEAMELGLKVSLLEDAPDLQEAVLSVHHSCIHTLSATGAYKIIENHLGVAFVQSASCELP